MADVKVKLKIKGINAVMKSAPVQSEVDRRAKRIADEAGDGFEYVARPHKWTARAFVQTNSRAGDLRQAKDNVLERSLDAGR